jgi:hypothetical protein
LTSGSALRTLRRSHFDIPSAARATGRPEPGFFTKKPGTIRANMAMVIPEAG